MNTRFSSTGACLGLALSLISVHCPAETHTQPVQTRATSSGNASADLVTSKELEPFSYPDQAVTNTPLSFWTAEIVKLVEAGISDEVMLAFMHSAGTFNLDADQIVHLKELGVADHLLTAMIQHDTDVMTGFAYPTAGVPTVDWKLKLASIDQHPPAHTRTAETMRASEKPKKNKPDNDLPLAEELLLRDGQHPAESARQNTAPLSRIREPYPVQLLDPIVVVKAPPRTPNILIVTFSR
jgi:hypothetical protein